MLPVELIIILEDWPTMRPRVLVKSKLFRVVTKRSSQVSARDQLSPAARACILHATILRARGLALGYTLSPAGAGLRRPLVCYPGLADSPWATFFPPLRGFVSLAGLCGARGFVHSRICSPEDSCRCFSRACSPVDSCRSRFVHLRVAVPDTRVKQQPLLNKFTST